MLLVVGALLVIALIFGPSLWVKFVMRRYASEKPEMPGTGGELAKHLIERFSLKDVEVEVTELGDHYDPNSKTVRVKPDRLDKKSITSITVMCHEIGHAIQDKENYPPLIRRQKIITKTAWLNKISSLLLYAGIPAILATGALPFIRVCVLIIFASHERVFFLILALERENLNLLIFIYAFGYSSESSILILL